MVVITGKELQIWRHKREERKRQNAAGKKKPFITVVKRGVFLDNPKEFKFCFKLMNRVNRGSQDRKVPKLSAVSPIPTVRQIRDVAIRNVELVELSAVSPSVLVNPGAATNNANFLEVESKSSAISSTIGLNRGTRKSPRHEVFRSYNLRITPEVNIIMHQIFQVKLLVSFSETPGC